MGCLSSKIIMMGGFVSKDPQSCPCPSRPSPGTMKLREGLMIAIQDTFSELYRKVHRTVRRSYSNSCVWLLVGACLPNSTEHQTRENKSHKS